MDRIPYRLDRIRRDAVSEAIQEVCRHRGGRLPALEAAACLGSPSLCCSPSRVTS